MALFRTIRRTVRSFFGKATPSFSLLGEGEMPASRDTLSVIHDLTQVARNNPEAIEIYMALGNLFRAQGDIERAVLIREGLIVRAGLAGSFKARACFELGQDYRRAGVVDRALDAYDEARKLGYDPEAVTAELAKLFAGAGSFEKAADAYGKLGHHIGEAHYLMRAAEEVADAGDTARAKRLLKKATRVYPGSVDAWSALILMAARAGEWRKVSSLLKQALYRVPPHLQFLLLELLYQEEHRQAQTIEAEGSSKPAPPAPHNADALQDDPSIIEAPGEASNFAEKPAAEEDGQAGADAADTAVQEHGSLEEALPQEPIDGVQACPGFEPHSATNAAVSTAQAERPQNSDRGFAALLSKVVIPILEKQPPHILLHYYGALLLKENQDIANAEIWLSKALVVQPDFWAARLELLHLAALGGEFSPSLAMQVEYFADQLQHIKRFVCTVCGLKQNQAFYLCPRCGSWHTVSYRLSLKD